MDFLIDGIRYSIVGGAFWWCVRVAWHRYLRAIIPDSNAPNGRRTDWALFWGRGNARRAT